MLSYKRHGAMRFLRIGRLCFTFVLAKSAVPAPKPVRMSRRELAKQVIASYYRGFNRGVADHAAAFDDGFINGYEQGKEAAERAAVEHDTYSRVLQVATGFDVEPNTNSVERLSDGSLVMQYDAEPNNYDRWSDDAIARDVAACYAVAVR